MAVGAIVLDYDRRALLPEAGRRAANDQIGRRFAQGEEDHGLAVAARSERGGVIQNAPARVKIVDGGAEAEDDGRVQAFVPVGKSDGKLEVVVTPASSRILEQHGGRAIVAAGGGGE